MEELRAKYNKFIDSLSKKPGDDTARWVVVTLVSTVALFVILSFGIVLIGYGNAPGRSSDIMEKDLALQPGAWRVLYEAENVDCGVVATIDCPANIHNRKLWESEFSRSDKEHYYRVQKRKGKVFWIGLSVDRDLFKRALKREANNLIIGYVNGDAEVYVDGTLNFKKTAGTIVSPIVLRFPYAQASKSASPPRIAIRIYHNQGRNFPDLLMFGRDGTFANMEATQSYLRSRAFGEEARPMILFTFNTIIALIFLFFYLASPNKLDFGFLAAYAGIHALIQAALLDYSSVMVTGEVLSGFRLATRVYEGGFALLLALTYARLRPRIFMPIFGLILVIPIVLLLLNESSQYLAIDQEVGSLFVVPAILVGVVICLGQAVRLEFDLDEKPYLRKRVWRLYAFTIGLCLLAIIYWINSQRIDSPSLVYVYRMGHVVVACYLVAIVLIDYKDAEKLNRKVSFSQWHRMDPMPTEVLGGILRIDMKSSVLMAQKAESTYHEFVRSWVNMVTMVAMRFDLKHLDDEGDEVTLFLEESSARRAFERVLKFIGELQIEQRFFMIQFGLDDEIYFRSAFVPKPIKPIWKNVGGLLKPDFDGDGWVDSKRFLEVESEYLKIIGMEKMECTTLVIDSSSKLSPEKSDSPKIVLLGDAHTIIDKNGLPRSIIVCATVESEGLKKMRA